MASLTSANVAVLQVLIFVLYWNASESILGSFTSSVTRSNSALNSCFHIKFSNGYFQSASSTNSVHPCSNLEQSFRSFYCLQSMLKYSHLIVPLTCSWRKSITTRLRSIPVELEIVFSKSETFSFKLVLITTVLKLDCLVKSQIQSGSQRQILKCSQSSLYS